jgi:mannose-6-phosphate isomerase-like protein (cupin superfamily)
MKATVLHMAAGACVRLLTLAPGESEQLRRQAGAHWTVLSGAGWLERRKDRMPLGRGSCCAIVPSVEHEVLAGVEPLVIAEVLYGDEAALKAAA